jgi:hypothetical protein
VLLDALVTEDEVVAAIRNALAARGCKIVSFASTNQVGIDVHATLGKRTIYIEAKGVTSSKAKSARFGQLQTSSQIFIQVAAALMKCAELKSASPDAYVAIAVPEHSRMRGRVERIEPVLRAADIGVLWVANDGTVVAWNAPWFKKLPRAALD